MTKGQLAWMMSRDTFRMGRALDVIFILPFAGRLRLPEDASGPAAGVVDSASRPSAQADTPDKNVFQPSGEGAPYKNAVNAQYPPDPIFTVQVAGQAEAGSTYWRVHSTSGDANLRTKGGIFATIGLTICSQAGPAARVVSTAPIWPLIMRRVAARSGIASLRGVLRAGGIDFP